MSRSYRQPVMVVGAGAERKRQYRRQLRHHLDNQVHMGSETVAKARTMKTDGYDVCDGRWFEPGNVALRRK